jgi:small conductance mechanosensitive channel
MLEEIKLHFTSIYQPLLIILGTIIVASIFQSVFRRIIKRKSHDLNNDPTNYKFLKHTLTALIYIVGFSWAVYSIPTLRVMATSMLAGAGILAVVIGFASQQALANVIAGVFIVIFKPFRINDRVQIKDNFYSGVVEDITLRHTVIRNFENRRIVIPNSLMSSEIIVNSDFGEDLICKFVDVGIAYESDVVLAKKILAEEVMNHPNWLDRRTDEEKQDNIPPVAVRVIALAESSVNLRAWAWAGDTAAAFEMQCDVLEKIKIRFPQEGISIPFPQRTIHFNTPLQTEKKA